MLQVMSVNVRGVFLCLRYALPLMVDTAEGKGAIVITSSTAGARGPGPWGGT
jgi:NAD(P)-dependent dehydrogenase (short-subunit alcohol dehydrogenase family)